MYEFQSKSEDVRDSRLFQDFFRDKALPPLIPLHDLFDRLIFVILCNLLQPFLQGRDPFPKEVLSENLSYLFGSYVGQPGEEFIQAINFLFTWVYFNRFHEVD